MIDPESKLLGQIMLGEGYLTQSQLEEAIAEQCQYKGLLLGTVLLGSGMITSKQLYKAICIREKVDEIITVSEKK